MKLNRFRILFFSLIAISILPYSAYFGLCKSDANFSAVRSRLISDGFNKNTIDALYDSPQMEMDYKVVRFFFVVRESKVNYGQFLEPDMIDNAKKYLKKHQASFQEAERLYGVDRSVIAAILLVETKLGSYLGRYSIFRSLSSIASLASPNVREVIWSQIFDSGTYTRERFDARADQKAEWAYNELKALLTYALQEKKNPLNFSGSYAGAMGICQFLPSNILTLAVDGNSDGVIDLFNDADAIYSVANYLKLNGWKPGISEQRASQVVYTYNNSIYYVNTILTISAILQR